MLSHGRVRRDLISRATQTAHRWMMRAVPSRRRASAGVMARTVSERQAKRRMTSASHNAATAMTRRNQLGPRHRGDIGGRKCRLGLLPPANSGPKGGPARRSTEAPSVPPRKRVFICASFLAPRYILVPARHGMPRGFIGAPRHQETNGPAFARCIARRHLHGWPVVPRRQAIMQENDVGHVSPHSRPRTRG